MALTSLKYQLDGSDVRSRLVSETRNRIHVRDIFLVMTKTAVILTGGHSRRYGRPKGLEKINGLTLIERLAKQAMDAGISEICLSANDRELYGGLGFKIIQDRFVDCGPLAGMHAALLETGEESILILPCDLPGLTSNEIKILLESADRDPADAVYAVTGSQEHPLCCVIRKSLIEPLEKTLSEDKHTAYKFFHEVHHRTVLFEDDQPFRNLNTPEDLKL